MTKDLHMIPFEGIRAVRGDGPGAIQLARRTIFTAESFHRAWSVYPVTIVQPRYGGTYEGSWWLCLPVPPEDLAELPFWNGWKGSDGPCIRWWDRAHSEGWPIGYG